MSRRVLFEISAGIANSAFPSYSCTLLMKIALAQFNPTVGDFAGNSAKMLQLAGQALERRADLVVFSELSLCGYLPLDLLERPQFIDRNERELRVLAGKLPLPAIVGFAGRSGHSTGKPAVNAAAFLQNGQIAFEQHKMLLPTYDVFDESRYFQPGPHRKSHIRFSEHFARDHDLRRHLERQNILGSPDVCA